MEIFEISDRGNVFEVLFEKPRFSFNEYGNLGWSNEGDYKRKILKRPSIHPSPHDDYLSPFFPQYRTRLGRKIFKGDTWVRELAVRPATNKSATAYNIERIRFQAKVDNPGQDPSNWIFYRDYHPFLTILSLMREIGSPENFIFLNYRRWEGLLSESEREDLSKISKQLSEDKKPNEYKPNTKIYDILLKEKAISSLPNVCMSAQYYTK